MILGPGFGRGPGPPAHNEPPIRKPSRRVFAYITRRVLTTIPLLVIALYLVHVGVSATTDPLADFYLCLPRCQEGFDQIEELYNLDVNVWLRPFVWFGDVLSGDLGDSSTIGEPVTDVLRTRGWNTAMMRWPVHALAAASRVARISVGWWP